MLVPLPFSIHRCRYICARNEYKVCLTVFEIDNLFLFSAWITGMEYEIKADLHPLLSSVLFCTFLYFIYLARRACLSPEGREHNFAHL